MSAILDALRKGDRPQDDGPESPESISREANKPTELFGSTAAPASVGEGEPLPWERPKGAGRGRAGDQPEGSRRDALLMAVTVALLTVPLSVFSALWVARVILAPPAAPEPVAAIQPDYNNPGNSGNTGNTGNMGFSGEGGSPGSAALVAPSLDKRPGEEEAGMPEVMEPIPVREAAPAHVAPGGDLPPLAQPAQALPPQQIHMVAVPYPHYYYYPPNYTGAPGMVPPPAGYGVPDYDHPAGETVRPAVPSDSAGVQASEPAATEVPALTPRKLVFDGILGNRAFYAGEMVGVGDEVEGFVISEIGSDYVAFENSRERARVR